MDRIIIHWTAGTNKPCSTDYEHYHYLVDGDGAVTTGKYSPEDNLNCNDGKYAAHCGGGNTGAIGISMCGMYGFKSASDVGKYPLTAKQVERTCKLVAELAKKYNIVINPQTVMTHYEFGVKHPKTTSAGKIDIIYLPPFPKVAKSDVGNTLRRKAIWYKNTL
jgi:N-acetyl-anhydromuramyl-L-alanine amidase AmpD